MEEKRAEVKLNPMKKLGANLAWLGRWLWLAFASVGTLFIIVYALFIKTSLM